MIQTINDIRSKNKMISTHKYKREYCSIINREIPAHLVLSFINKMTY